MRSVAFLPVSKRPTDSVLQWAGEKESSALLPPETLYPSELSALLCYVEPVLDISALGIIGMLIVSEFYFHET